MIQLSPAFCGGLIEAIWGCARWRRTSPLSPAFCGGLIEARRAGRREAAGADFPPRSAGASLKPRPKCSVPGVSVTLSPAFCGGLIEAGRLPGVPGRPLGHFPPRSAGASLKRFISSTGICRRIDFPPRSAGASLKRDLAGAGAARGIATFPRVLRGPH